MKVILLQDVAKVGRKNEIKEVADGFGRNGLILKGKAILATPEMIRKYEQRAQQQAEGQTKEQQALLRKLELINAKGPVVLEVKANKEGHLFAGITRHDISEAIRTNCKVEIPEDIIQLEKPLKLVGVFDLSIQSGEVAGQVKVEIKPLG
jgi:large subunit ribosomal protein L9